MRFVRSGWRIALKSGDGTYEVKRVQECESHTLHQLQSDLTECANDVLRRWRVLTPGDVTPVRVSSLDAKQVSSLADAVSDEVVGRMLQHGRLGKTRPQRGSSRVFLEAKARREAEATREDSLSWRAFGDRRSRGEELMKRFLNILLAAGHVDNYRPPWLDGLEVDRYYPELLAGFEFQGDQHFRLTEFSQDLASVRSRDKLKARLCWKRGIKLIRIEAADLSYSRMCTILASVPKAGLLVREHHLEFTSNLSRAHRDELKRLNKEAAGYRAFLNRAFPAHISSRKLRSKARRLAEQHWFQRGTD